MLIISSSENPASAKTFLFCFPRRGAQDKVLLFFFKNSVSVEEGKSETVFPLGIFVFSISFETNSREATSLIVLTGETATLILKHNSTNSFVVYFLVYSSISL